ncbi:hypothetical protein K435DRAFT_898934 [Dendrothele bispora CBS 962.96]|uniref:Uncharacterized protein n=1 Tax=Dendrothele bispora (strain CBS 962.96) TaxID=1314807 RepID=A0A4S8MPR0_DENBC|nr:hypothetical protein K435DRAFT_898934 [Dendrothele bispora CBS 962.96]
MYLYKYKWFRNIYAPECLNPTPMTRTDGFVLYPLGRHRLSSDESKIMISWSTSGNDEDGKDGPALGQLAVRIKKDCSYELIERQLTYNLVSASTIVNLALCIICLFLASPLGRTAQSNLFLYAHWAWYFAEITQHIPPDDKWANEWAKKRAFSAFQNEHAADIDVLQQRLLVSSGPSGDSGDSGDGAGAGSSSFDDMAWVNPMVAVDGPACVLATSTPAHFISYAETAQNDYAISRPNLVIAAFYSRAPSIVNDDNVNSILGGSWYHRDLASRSKDEVWFRISFYRLHLPKITLQHSCLSAGNREASRIQRKDLHKTRTLIVYCRAFTELATEDTLDDIMGLTSKLREVRILSSTKGFIQALVADGAKDGSTTETADETQNKPEIKLQTIKRFIEKLEKNPKSNDSIKKLSTQFRDQYTKSEERDKDKSTIQNKVLKKAEEKIKKFQEKMERLGEPRIKVIDLWELSVDLSIIILYARKDSHIRIVSPSYPTDTLECLVWKYMYEQVRFPGPRDPDIQNFHFYRRLSWENGHPSIKPIRDSEALKDVAKPDARQEIYLWALHDTSSHYAVLESSRKMMLSNICKRLDREDEYVLKEMNGELHKSSSFFRKGTQNMESLKNAWESMRDTKKPFGEVVGLLKSDMIISGMDTCSRSTAMLQPTTFPLPSPQGHSESAQEGSSNGSYRPTTTWNYKKVNVAEMPEAIRFPKPTHRSLLVAWNQVLILRGLGGITMKNIAYCNYPRCQGQALARSAENENPTSSITPIANCNGSSQWTNDALAQVFGIEDRSQPITIPLQTPPAQSHNLGGNADNPTSNEKISSLRTKCALVQGPEINRSHEAADAIQRTVQTHASITQTPQITPPTQSDRGSPSLQSTQRVNDLRNSSQTPDGTGTSNSSTPRRSSTESDNTRSYRTAEETPTSTENEAGSGSQTTSRWSLYGKIAKVVKSTFGWGRS